MEKKLFELLQFIVEYYVEEEQPIGSTYLYERNVGGMAPSTLRKYMNILEKQGFIFQPYPQAGRVPTDKGFSYYIKNVYYDTKIEYKISKEFYEFMKYLGKYVSGVIFGLFNKKDFYYYGIHSAIQKRPSYEALNIITDYLENKKILDFLDKDIKIGELKYFFIKNNLYIIVYCLYGKIIFNGYNAILGILAPTKSDFKTNVSLMKFILDNI